VETFTLRGIERLAAPGDFAAETPARILPAARVAPGHVRLGIDARLPAGYKRSTEVDAVIEVQAGAETIRKSFRSYEPIAWALDLREPLNVQVNLTLYYCHAAEAQLCMIHDARLVLPVQVAPGAPAEAIVEYNVGAGAQG
jgi:hypothetical protein